MVTLKCNLEVVDFFSVVDSAHILHQYVHLTASFPSHVDSYGFVPFKNPHRHLEKKSAWSYQKLSEFTTFLTPTMYNFHMFLY